MEADTVAQEKVDSEYLLALVLGQVEVAVDAVVVQQVLVVELALMVLEVAVAANNMPTLLEAVVVLEVLVEVVVVL